jgi:hypothetical protein
LKRHFVTFYSPGTFVAETSEKPIDKWDVKTAVEMARSITERYGATPYGFRFSTRERKPDELDSKVAKSSGMYFINCKVLTVEDIVNQRNPKNEILIGNMRHNGWDRVVQTKKGWVFTLPLGKDDIVLED